MNPVVQEAGKLQAGTSVPNTVITEQAVKALHETPVPVGWLIQAPSALTAVQINAGRQAGSVSAPPSRRGPGSSASARSATAPPSAACSSPSACSR